MVQDDKNERQQTEVSLQKCMGYHYFLSGTIFHSACSFLTQRKPLPEFAQVPACIFTYLTEQSKASSFLCPFEVKTKSAVKSNTLLKRKKPQKLYH